MEDEIKTAVLRPFGGQIIQMLQDINTGKVKKPKTVAEAQLMTERMVEQAYEKLKPYLKEVPDER